MDSEAGVFAMTFDQSGSRLITCDADKTIKIYKEDDTAVSEGEREREIIIIIYFYFLCFVVTLLRGVSLKWSLEIGKK